MQALTKIASQKKIYAPCKYILFDGNTAMATDLEVWAVTNGAWNFEKPTLIHVDTVKAALKIDKVLTWADGKLNGIKPAALKDNMQPSDLPKWLKPTGTPAMIDNIDLDQLKAIFAATADGDIRYYLNGVCFNLDDAAIIGCDGHRLHIAANAFTKTEGVDGERIVPNTAMELGIAAKMDGIAFYHAHAIISHEAGFIVSKLVEGKFPDYKRVMPEYKDITPLVGDTGEQLAAIKNAQAALGRAKFHRIAIDTKTGALRADKDGEAIYSAQFFKPSDRDVAAGYQASYVADILSHTKRAAFYIQDATSSALIHCDNFVAVLMPCRA